MIHQSFITVKMPQISWPFAYFCG